MKTTNRSLLFVIALSISTAANAAGSMLRITCEGDNVGAEILISGKYKGQCPLDVQVPEGNVQLIYSKKYDAKIQKVFISKFQIGDGVVKRVEVPDSQAEGWRFTKTDEYLQEIGKSFAADLKAAKSGDINKMGNVGGYYLEGAGVTKNVDVAISWLIKAAEAGNIGAMFALAALYSKGEDVQPNFETSYYWLRKAIALGDKRAEDYMAALHKLEASRSKRKASDESH